jgi:hypothetical protein
LVAIMLALAIASIFLAIWASQARLDVQGPSALAISPDGSSWLAVEREIWQIDASGRRIQSLPGPSDRKGVAQLMLRPNGTLWAVIQGEEVVYALDGSSWGKAVRLQWQADLHRHGTRAQTLAIAADGRIAAATGGGHAVALFAPDGNFIARTPPGTYQFTNGLWFEGETLWTTDTNGGALVRLELPSMKVLQRLSLKFGDDRQRFLGAANPWPQSATPNAQTPLAAQILFRGDMKHGHAVAVATNGSVKPFFARESMQPLDVQWHAASQSWWVVDAESFQVMRWTANGDPLPPAFADDVRALLEGQRAANARLAWQYYGGLGAGVALFMLAIVGLGIRKLREQRAAAAMLAWKLGTPDLSFAASLRLRLSNWPFMLPLLALFCIQLLPRDQLRSAWSVALTFAPSWFWLGLACAYVLITIALAIRAQKRFATEPEFEPLVNAFAITMLKRNTQALELADGEKPREATSFQHGLRTDVLVLTNQRLMFYRLQGLGRLKLHLAIPWHYVQRFEHDGKQVVRVEAQNGEKHKKWELISHTQSDRTRRATAAAPRQLEPAPSALQVAVASMLIPGLGQSLQGRKETALSHFVMAIIIASVAAYVWWLALAPRTQVDIWLLVFASVGYAMMAFSSAWEAFAHSREHYSIGQ